MKNASKALPTNKKAMGNESITVKRFYWSYQLALENFDPRQKTMTVEDGSLRKPPNDAYNKSSNRVLIRTEDITKTVKTIKTVRGQRR